jgi:hypothetical protein
LFVQTIELLVRLEQIGFPVPVTAPLVDVVLNACDASFEVFLLLFVSIPGPLVGFFFVFGGLRIPDGLRKLVAKVYGEIGQAREEYYFWDDRLFFVLRVKLRYDKPFGKVVSKPEERFYFADDALIRWLDPRKKEVSAGPEMQQRGRDYLARAKKYSALVKK